MCDDAHVDAERFAALAVALGIGFLIGLQREQSASREGTTAHLSLGGVRTYPLVALTGALSVLLAPFLGAWIAGAAFLPLLLLMGLAYADDLRQKRDRGITSEVALLLTFLLGCLSTADGLAGPLKERLLLCAALAVAVTALLSYKDPLHALVSRISRDDLYATVKFGILALVVLPLLPNGDYGPFRALNPARIGLFVVLIAATSFCGYVAVRILGPGRGLGITGLIGGFVSSTAIAVSFSQRAGRQPAAARACAMGIILASTIMGLRVVGLVAITNPSLVRLTAVPLGALSLAGAGAGMLLYLRSRRESVGADTVQFSNPFELGSALKFGVLLTFVLVAVKAAIRFWGERGSYVAALLAGTVDVDAITLSFARMAPAELTRREAAVGIFLACVSNTVVKAAIAVILGGWKFGWRVVLAMTAMTVAGASGAAWLMRS